MTTALDALELLRAGNRRFASGTGLRDRTDDRERRSELVHRQAPLAVILGCSDSRVPAELVFDQGLGDLFVIRVAGNVVYPSQIGSVEFAVRFLGTRLIVVLGHTGCGAVQAALEQLERPEEIDSVNLLSIVKRIQTSLAPLVDSRGESERQTPMAEAVRANIRASAELLRRGSAILEPLLSRGELLLVGGEYSLETGLVDFFDGLPRGG